MLRLIIHKKYLRNVTWFIRSKELNLWRVRGGAESHSQNRRSSSPADSLVVEASKSLKSYWNYHLNILHPYFKVDPKLVHCCFSCPQPSNANLSTVWYIWLGHQWLRLFFTLSRFFSLTPICLIKSSSSKDVCNKLCAWDLSYTALGDPVSTFRYLEFLQSRF